MKVLASASKAPEHKSNPAIGSSFDSFLTEQNLHQDVMRRAQLEFLEIVNPSITNNAGYKKTYKLLDDYLNTKKREKALMEMVRACTKKRQTIYKEYLFAFDQLKKDPSFTPDKQKMYCQIIENMRKTASALG